MPVPYEANVDLATPRSMSEQTGEPQSGLVAINSLNRDGGIANCGAWGTREENRVKLSRDSASAAAFNTPGTCTRVMESKVGTVKRKTPQ